jgi:hypothetical protein
MGEKRDRPSKGEEGRGVNGNEWEHSRQERKETLDQLRLWVVDSRFVVVTCSGRFRLSRNMPEEVQEQVGAMNNLWPFIRPLAINPVRQGTAATFSVCE